MPQSPGFSGGMKNCRAVPRLPADRALLPLCPIKAQRCRQSPRSEGKRCSQFLRFDELLVFIDREQLNFVGIEVESIASRTHILN
jgi:hypothetical protein